MTELDLNFGVLLEITEDWIRNSQIENRIMARSIDGEDEIQFRLECHKYHIDKDCLFLTHYLGSEDDELEEEFRHMLHKQY